MPISHYDEENVPQGFLLFSNLNDVFRDPSITNAQVHIRIRYYQRISYYIMKMKGKIGPNNNNL